MKQRRNSLVLAWFLCLSASANVCGQNIELLLKQRVNSHRNQASIVVAVVDETGTKFWAYGKRSKLKAARPSNENTIFEIGSITKVFTRILLADAIKRGEVKLDDPISKYLPNHNIYERRGRKCERARITSEGRSLRQEDQVTRESGTPQNTAETRGNQ